ncbi:hypothetical protein Tco_0596715 [Tanacetum coccineum]
MSSASSAVTYTSVYTDSEPGRVFWGADEELSDGGSPRVIVYGYDGLPMQPVAPPSSDYVSGPDHPPSPVEVPYIPEPEYPEYLVPSDNEAPMKDQPLPADASPVALSPGYVADSNPEEDSEEDHADYPADGGDDDDEPSDNDDDDDTRDEDEEPFEDEEDDEEEEEHLAPADSSAIPITDPLLSAKDTKALETDEAAPTPIPSPRRHTARMSVRPQTPVPFPFKAEFERLLALPIPPPSPLTPLSQIPSPPLPPPPSSLHLPPPVPTSLPLPLSPLPPLPASLFIPPVDRKEDTLEAELPPRKRLCLTALAPRYEVGESSTAAPRPTGGHGADYGFIGTVDAEEQDTQDIYAVVEDTQDRQTQIYQRVDILAEDRQFYYETARLLDQEALGQKSAALGQIQALHARDQTHAGDRKGAGSSA